MENQINIKNILLNGHVDEIIDLLVNGVVEPMDLVIPGHLDVLLKMIINHYPNYVEALLNNGYDVNKYGFNYLLSSLQVVNKAKRDFTVFSILLPYFKKEAYVKENNLNVSAWNFSFDVGYLKPISLMLKAGMDINHRDSLGRTGLHYYLRGNNVSDNFMKLILQNKGKINWNVKDNFNISLLDILNSAKHSYDWIAIKNHCLLLEGLGISYEKK